MKTLNDGSIQIEETAQSVTTPTAVIYSTFKRLIFDTFGLLFLVLTLPFLFLFNHFFPTKQKRVMVGTHPIVSNIHYKHILEKVLDGYSIEIFVFQDWLNEPEYYDFTSEDIVPKWLAGNASYSITPYFILLWALRRYKGFWWHMDGALLERTLFWKLEPLILQLFNKKLLMQAYGADQWSLLQSADNLSYKLGLAAHRKRYFMLDFKRIKRNYMWAKYADIISGDFRYLPRVSTISMAHYYIELDTLPFNFNQKIEPIIISHFANHPERKGSYAIEAICNELISEGYSIKYQSIHGVSRQEALALLDESHIFIEHLFNGTFGTAAFEAMAKGNVVLTNIDQKVIELLLTQHYEFYGPFFKKLPLINVNVHTLKNTLITLIENKASIKEKIYTSRRFVEKSTQRVLNTAATNTQLQTLFDKAT